MKNKTNAELVALLTDPEQKEVAGLLLLQQSASIDDLSALLYKNVQQQAAWELFKNKATKEQLVGLICWRGLRDELEEVLLQFELELIDLRMMIIWGCGKEATWQRLLLQSPDIDTFRILLEYCETSFIDVIAEYLLSQPDDHALLMLMMKRTSLGKAAWERLKKKPLDAYSLTSVLLKSEFKEEAWEIFLAQGPEKKALHHIMAHSEEWCEIAAAELLKRDPTKKDLLCIVSNANQWEYAWAELLKQGLENTELFQLIYHTGFRPAWEQLKKQSPESWHIRQAINYEHEGHEELWDEIGAYLLTQSPTNNDLEFLIDYVPAVREAAIDLLLQQRPTERDLNRIKKYREIEIDYDNRLMSNSELVDKIRNDVDRRTEWWQRLLQQSPSNEDLAFLVRSSDFIELPAEMVLQRSPTREQLKPIIEYSKLHKVAAWNQLLPLSPTTSEISWMMIIPEMQELVAAELLKRDDVESGWLFEIINSTSYKEEAWQLLKNRSGAERDWLFVLLRTTYKEKMWAHWKKENMDQHVLTTLIINGVYKEEALEELRMRLGVQPEDEESLIQQIANKVLDEGGELLAEDEQHRGDAHTLAGWVTVFSAQAKQLEVECDDTETAAAVIAPSLAHLFSSDSPDEVRDGLVQIRLGAK